jgi:hypothetical protein
MGDTSSNGFDPTDDPIDIDTPPETPTASEPIDPEAAPEEDAHRDGMISLAEAVRLRERAREAEARAVELSGRIDELERLVAQTREALDSVERRNRIDQALLEADAIDLESARLLTELALGQMETPDEASAVAELRSRKPFLFRARARQTASRAMSGRPRDAEGDGLLEAAEEAARSGDRRSLLRYLEARRRRTA